MSRGLFLILVILSLGFSSAGAEELTRNEELAVGAVQVGGTAAFWVPSTIELFKNESDQTLYRRMPNKHLVLPKNVDRSASYLLVYDKPISKVELNQAIQRMRARGVPDARIEKIKLDRANLQKDSAVVKSLFRMRSPRELKDAIDRISTQMAKEGKTLKVVKVSYPKKNSGHFFRGYLGLLAGLAAGKGAAEGLRYHFERSVGNEKISGQSLKASFDAPADATDDGESEWELPGAALP